MSKRFTDTEKWERPWFRELPNEYKLLWLYVLDRCDIAGIWYVDFKLFNFLIESKADREQAENLFKKQIEIKGDRWLIKDFIGFQYGHLTEKNKLFWKVKAKFENFLGSKVLKTANGGFIPHISPINGVKDKDKDNNIDIPSGEGVKGKGAKNEEPPGEPYVLNTPIHRIFSAYKQLKGFEKNDREWDKLYFKRFSRSAKDLLQFFKGDLEKAVDCVLDLGTDFDKKNLTWTFETVVKNAENWKPRLAESNV